MCGRFVGSFSVGDLLAEVSAAAVSAGLRVPELDEEVRLLDDFNVAPTRDIPVLKRDGESLVIDRARWGLVPTWAKELRASRPLVNARSETVQDKPSFRDLLEKNRCIVPMNGFYEWDRTDARNPEPYFVPRADGRLMLCLGLWSRPKVLEGRDSVAILTAASGDDLCRIHDRVPVQVEASTALEWLCDDQDPLSCLSERAPALAPHRVSTKVNSVRNNGAELVRPLKEESRSDGPLFE